jgi:hypothetical protein
MTAHVQPSLSHQPSDTACVHRWRIGRPVENVCPAICAHCGATRDYPGSVTTSRHGAPVSTPRVCLQRMS